MYTTTTTIPLFLPHVEGMLDDGKISNKQESRCGIVFFLCVCH